jgi:tyrosinase
MTDEAKLEYTRAVKCLWSLPGKGTADFPAVRNRHEDFSSLHINQTTAPDPTNNPASKK